MSADNETLLEIVNSIAVDLTGTEAVSSGVNPTKNNIIEKINDKQKDIVNTSDWLFAVDIQTVHGYEVSADSDTITAGTILFESTGLRTSPLAGKTEYYAQKITTGDSLCKLISVPINLKIGGQGAGEPSGSISLYICEDSGGNPDIDNPVMTADSLSLSLAGSAWAEHLFIFTKTDDVLLKNQDYWIVFKWVGAGNNGDSMFVAVDPVSDTTATTLKTRLNNASTWTTQTGVLLSTQMSYYEADYITTLTLPTGVQKIYRLFSEDDNLLQFSTTNYMANPDNIPKGYFVPRKLSDGSWEIYINPVNAETKDWTLEYKKVCPALVNDGDYPIIPANYRALLKKGVLLTYISMGLGMQDTGAIALLQAEYEKMLKDMKSEYLPNPVIRIGVSKQGYTPASSSFLNYSPNTWRMK